MALQNSTNFASDATHDIGAARPPTAPTRSRSSELRSLAAWYRSLAEKAGEPAIWEKRLLTADRLEEEAAHIEEALRRGHQEEQR